MRDYAALGMALFWQRMAIYAIGLAIGAYYVSYELSEITFVLLAISETYDFLSFRRILSMADTDQATDRRNLRTLCVGAALNAGPICFAVLWISAVQSDSTHYVAHFLLFASSLFAAMNSHQLLPVMKVRLILYGATFMFIPISEIVQARGSLSSPGWMYLFTNAFFLYFIVETARIFMRLYQRQMEQIDKLVEEHEKVEAAYKVKTEFLSTMSHELRTPMTSINGAVILARSGKLGELPARADAALGIAETNCRRLSSLINDILDLQRIEAGRMEFDLRPLELGEFIRAALTTNSPYGAEFKVSYIAELPSAPVYVQADRRRLDQVMSNLLSNAAKFSHAGDTVTVRLEVDSLTVRILVVDTGIGLAEDKHDLVFDKFSQVDSSDRRQMGGTGLGMNITKRILEAHDATIGYRKNAEAGTTFIVEMKRCAPPREQQDSNRSAA